MTKLLNKQTIGVGVAGTGFIGPAHVEGLRRNGITVLGLAEANPDLAEKKAAEMGIPRHYPTFEGMLADHDIDIVHLAVPNLLHYPYAKAALLAGKHVVCEKPLAMTAVESAELVQSCGGKKAGQCYQFQYPHVSTGAAGAQHGAKR